LDIGVFSSLPPTASGLCSFEHLASWRAVTLVSLGGQSGQS
jgi:hypothetical protein